MTSFKDCDPDVQPFRSSFAHQGREALNVRSELALDRHDDTVGDPLPVRTSRRLEADRRRAVCRATADRRLIRPVVLRGVSGHHEINGQIFGIGLAITAYLFGVRHAFDADRSRPSTTPPASSSPTVNDRCPWGCSSPSGTPPWCS
jgi:hypothetical protein